MPSPQNAIASVLAVVIGVAIFNFKEDSRQKSTANSTSLVIDQSISLGEHLRRCEAMEDKGSVSNAVTYYTALLPECNSSAGTLKVLNRLGAAQRALRRHADAFATHTATLQHRGKSGATTGEYLITLTEMITDRYLDFEFDAALEVLAYTREQLQEHLTDEASGLLFKMEAHVYYCKGEFKVAENRIRRGRKLAELSMGSIPSEHDYADMIRHKLYLTTLHEWMQSVATRHETTPAGRSLHERISAVILTSTTSSTPLGSTSVTVKEVHSAIEALSHQLIARGKWTHPLQLPMDYVPGLTARAWHSRESWPTLEPLFAVLEAYHPRLQHEFRLLYVYHRPLPRG
eukprot:m.259436 g.259436  ORF g.259436 m.259436 type:complete len:345 (-) comp19665_c0_seq4:967-2001(-)